MDTNFLVKRNRDKRFKNAFELSSFLFHYDNKKLFVQAGRRDKNIILFGKIIDSRNSNMTTKEIATDLLEAENMEELLEYSRFLAGRYIIIFEMKDQLWILPDATTSIPVYYTVKGYEVSVSSRQKLISDELELELSNSAMKIKASAEEQQPLPYDITMYDGIKIVIPNHYLNLKEQSVNRYFPTSKIQQKSVEKVVEETLSLTQNVVDNYMSERDLIIPLTAGKDSRLVLSFFKNYQDRIKLYTFNHQPADPEQEDIRIPRELTKKFGLPYQVFPRQQLDKTDYGNYKSLFSGTQNKRILENALTLKNSDYRDQSFVTGDIFPLFKINFGRKLP